MEKISWLDKVTYEEDLETVNEDRQILNSIFGKGNVDGLAIIGDKAKFCLKLLKTECE